jgi:hypothetical protein
MIGVWEIFTVLRKVEKKKALDLQVYQGKLHRFIVLG